MESEEITKWCSDCGETVICHPDSDGTQLCPHCGKFLGGCKAVSMEGWKRKKALKNYHLLINNILKNDKPF